MNASSLTRWDHAQTRIAQFQLARELATTALDQYRQYRSRRNQKVEYFVSIEEHDDLYELVQNMIVESLPSEDRRALLAETGTTYDSNKDQNVYSLSLMYDGKVETVMNIDGHDVRVKVSREEPNGVNGTSAASSSNWIDQLLSSSDGVLEPAGDDERRAGSFDMRVTFTAESLAGRDAVVAKLAELSDTLNTVQRKSRFLVAHSAGHWTSRTRLQQRPLDSVILPGENLQAVINDLEYFASTEKRYVELGLPWHRGYLFYGPPGTGKTSLASALATHFGFDVYYLPLSSIDSDSKLLDLVSNIDASKAILILEDIDIVHAARERDDKDKGITLVGLLNALDGIGTPHGLIMVMTTNVRDVLDPALVRPGRVDLEMEVGYVTDDQLHRLIERFHGSSLELPEITGNIAPAEIVGLFKNTLDDELLRSQLVTLIERRNAGEEPEQVHSTKINPGPARRRPIRASSISSEDFV